MRAAQRVVVSVLMSRARKVVYWTRLKTAPIALAMSEYPPLLGLKRTFYVIVHEPALPITTQCLASTASRVM